jgi:type IV secretory pathway VirB10-like protein
MMLADMNKWISGETEAFFDPLQTPSAVSGDNKSGEGRLTARSSIRRFVHLAIAAVIGAFAAVALIYLVALMRAPVESSRAADEKSQSSGSGTLVLGGRALGEVKGARPITASPTEITSTPAMPILNQPTTALPDARLATPRQERKPAAPQRASRRDRPGYSVSDQAEREETARLMRDELWQRGVAVGAASGSGHPE